MIHHNRRHLLHSSIPMRNKYKYYYFSGDFRWVVCWTFVLMPPFLPRTRKIYSIALVCGHRIRARSPRWTCVRIIENDEELLFYFSLGVWLCRRYFLQINIAGSLAAPMSSSISGIAKRRYIVCNECVSNTRFACTSHKQTTKTHLIVAMAWTKHR